MYPLVFSLLGAVLLAFSLVAIQPRDVETINKTQADAMAANFWVYRGALVAYQNDIFASSASVTGFIADTKLLPPLAAPLTPAIIAKHPIGYFPVGYKALQTGTPAVNLWKNYFNGPQLYTFSSVAATSLPAGVIDAIANRNGRSLMIGIKQGNGTLTSMFIANAPPTIGATYTLPAAAAIPVGALVVIGN